ncbi:rhombosortase, partial [Herminiimonas sp.]|uniref:rhombosortase n=1 Tax=Herminiimonas sp. TaxID=1926289 RepID=UPI002723C222
MKAAGMGVTGAGSWRLCLLLCLLAILLALLPQSLRVFAYDRQALLDGQFWRLLSAHLVHVNGWHLLFNLAGLLLLCELLWQRLPACHAVGLLLASAVAVSAGLWLSMPELQRYAGLSGVLHGIWAGSALLLLLRPAAIAGEARIWWALSLLALAGKLLSEALGVASPALSMTGVVVITQAHALGAAGGLAYAIAAWFVGRMPGRWCGMTRSPAFD